MLCNPPPPKTKPNQTRTEQNIVGILPGVVARQLGPHISLGLGVTAAASIGTVEKERLSLAGLAWNCSVDMDAEFLVKSTGLQDEDTDMPSSVFTNFTYINRKNSPTPKSKHHLSTDRNHRII